METLQNLVVIISPRYNNDVKVIGPFNFLSEAQKFVLFSANKDRKSDGKAPLNGLEADYHDETHINIFDITELRELS